MGFMRVAGAVNRIGRLAALTLATLTLLLVAGCSEEDTGREQEPGDPPSSAPATEPAPRTTAEMPLLEPTVRDPEPRGPEELRRAQQELDAQCAEMDLEEAQNMGMDPEEFGCEPDGTGVPVQEWAEQGR